MFHWEETPEGGLGISAETAASMIQTYGSKAIVFPPEELEEVAGERKDVSFPASRMDG